VYSFAHIGNLRAYLFMDFLRRVLKLNGNTIEGVMNITDVGHLLSDGDEGEDKMVKAAREEKMTPYEIAASYTEVFFNDLAALNIERPEHTPKATDNIPEMISYIEALLKKGYAYALSDGVYFDTQKFEGYGALSGQKNEAQPKRARVTANDKKRHGADFALWKSAEKEHIMQWQSPWGAGYPGWHIECSAMSEKYLGDYFDIHTGGVDHIPIHHENEIAQSEAKNGRRTVNVWMHGEFVLVDGGKMSKSLKNTYTLKQLSDKGLNALDFRYFCLNAHYRQRLNFTFEGMRAAQTALARLRDLTERHRKGDGAVDGELLSMYKREFLNAVNDDLNIPQALGILWRLVKENKSKKVYDLILFMDKIFGLDLDKQNGGQETAEPLPPEVKRLARLRLKAREEKNYAEADRLRGQIETLGFKVLDGKDGMRIIK
jgi:cysteinyl-tRNA synthetase